MKVNQLIERSDKENELNSIEGFAAKMKTREEMIELKKKLKIFSDKHGNMGDRVHDIVDVIAKRGAQYNLLDY